MGDFNANGEYNEWQDVWHNDKAYKIFRSWEHSAKVRDDHPEIIDNLEINDIMIDQS